MSVQVGTLLNYKGSRYLCVAINKNLSQILAPDPAAVMRAELLQVGNTKYLRFEIGEFEKDDIITIDAEWCVLRTATDTQLIYSKYVVKKEGDENGSTGNASESNANQAPSSEAQTANERAESGGGNRH